MEIELRKTERDSTYGQLSGPWEELWIDGTWQISHPQSIHNSYILHYVCKALKSKGIEINYEIRDST